VSYTTYSKVATLNRVNHEQLALELLLVGVICEYPSCVNPAVSVAESGVSMFMCLGHATAWGTSSQLRRVIEMARLTELDEEMMRTVAAAFEDPGERIHWDGNSPLASHVFAGAETVLESYQKREALPLAVPYSEAPSILDSKSNKTLSTLTSANEYDMLEPFFL
jgi:hypothetical protein